MKIRHGKHSPSSDPSGEIASNGKLGAVTPHLRVFSIGLGIFITLVLVMVGICAFCIYEENWAPANANLPIWQTGVRNERALIFAPHCDDETIACGGIIKRLLARGDKVLVVVATNGDGFRLSVSRQFGKVNVNADDFIRFGYLRQQESIAALKHLGLKSEDVIFLGYPDRGLAPMWLNNWEATNLFYSSYTNSDHSPYKNAFHFRTPYCGEALLINLKEILRSFQPTTVYYPHTYEAHSDHWAAGCYMTEALYETGLLNKVRSGLYIVHRGDWPVPQGLAEGRSLPPPGLLKGLGTEWHEFDICTPDEKEKLSAVQMYKTQTSIPSMNRFLLSFVRNNELFGTYPPATIRRISNIKDVSDIEWNSIEPSILDAVGDSTKVNMDPAGDIKEIKCCYDDKKLYIRLGLAYKRGRTVSYAFHIHPLPMGSARPLNVQVKESRCDSDGVCTSLGQDALEITVPLSRLGKWKALMINADSKFKNISLDSTAWRLLLPENQSPQIAKNMH